MTLRGGSVLAVFIVAGCLGQSPPQGPPGGEGPPMANLGTPGFAKPSFIGEGGRGVSEASLEIGADETMLTCTVGPNTLWASQDGGGSWSAFEPLRGRMPNGNGDCDVTLGLDGSWSFVAAGFAPPGFGKAELLVATSSDRGTSWSVHEVQPPPACPAGGDAYGVPPCTMDRPWIRAVAGSLYLTYKTGNMNPLLVFFQKSSDRGATWSPPVVVTSGNERYTNGNVGHMDVADEGRTIRVPIHRFLPVVLVGITGPLVDTRGQPQGYDLAVSRDSGDSWTLQTVADSLVGHFSTLPSGVRATGGALYFALPVMNESKVDLQLTTSLDDGRTWSPPFALASSVDFGPSDAYVALDALPNGGASAAWYHWADEGDRTGWVTTVSKVDASMSPPVAWTVDATAPAGKEAEMEFIGLDHDASGRVHIVYPVPEVPCAAGDRDFCLYHVAEADGA